MNKQHGFRLSQSTPTCNADFCNHIFKAFNAHSKIDIIYTNVEKAFDHVDHLSLMSILKETGFGEPLLSWFHSYIDNKKQ